MPRLNEIPDSPDARIADLERQLRQMEQRLINLDEEMRQMRRLVARPPGTIPPIAGNRRDGYPTID